MFFCEPSLSLCEHLKMARSVADRPVGEEQDCTWPTTQRGRRLLFASLLQMIMGFAMIGIGLGVLFVAWRPSAASSSSCRASS